MGILLRQFKALREFVEIMLAWHEIGTYCEWIFGEYLYEEEILYNISEELELTYDEVKAFPKDELDKMVRKFVEEEDGDYCDMEVGEILIEINDKNEIIKTYMEL